MSRTTVATYVERSAAVDFSLEKALELATIKAESQYWERIQSAVEQSRELADYYKKQIEELIALRDIGIEGGEHTKVINELADVCNGYGAGSIFVTPEDFPKLRKLYPQVTIGKALEVWDADKALVKCEVNVGEESKVSFMTVRALPTDAKCKIETTMTPRVSHDLICDLNH